MGLDASRPMLAAAGGPGAREARLLADMGAIPLRDASVDVMMAGYALRNAPDLRIALSEVRRSLRPGGWLMTLDFYLPRHRWWRAASVGYLGVAGGLYGRLWHGVSEVYRYIARSLDRWLAADSFCALLAEYGFEVEDWVEKLGGAIAIHWARNGGVTSRGAS